MDQVTENVPPIKTEALIKRQKSQKTEREKASKETPRETLERFANKDRQKKIEEIDPIQNQRTELKSRKDIEELIEPPLREAVGVFFDKGIQTLSSGANKTDVEKGYAHIILDFGSLSPENKKILEGMTTHTIKRGENYDKGLNSHGQEVILDLSESKISEGKPTVYIKFPLSPQSTSGQVEDASVALAEKFRDQPITWVKIQTVEEFKKENSIPADTQIPDEEFGEFGLYKDPLSNMIYPSEELYEAIKSHEKDL